MLVKGELIMSSQTVGFIGAGRVARIILGGWKKSGQLPSRVVLFDCDSETCDSLKSLGEEIETATTAEETTAQDIVFLAVHPPVIKDVMGAIKDQLKSHSVLVSLAPKFTIAKLSEMLGGFSRIARMIPNAPSVIGRGYNPMAFGDGLNDAHKQVLRNLFTPLGECPEVAEGHLEAYAILSAMGPTYFWPQLYTLKSLGESFGLTDEAIVEALDKMLWGSVAMMKESGLSQAKVQDLIPVKPMAEEVESLCIAYEHKLKGLMEKIRP
jgi:pyrroline-5-carboxylate reductase